VECVGWRAGGRDGTGVCVGIEGGCAVGNEGDATGKGLAGVGVSMEAGVMVGPDQS